MNKYFSGKQIKELSKQKNFNHLVFEFNGCYQTLEFTYEDRRENSEQITRIELRRDHNIHKNESLFRTCYMYAGSNNTTWNYFIESLKPSDKVFFYMRNDSSVFLNELGLISQSLRAVVTTFKDDRILRQKELTIMNNVMEESNHQAFFKASLHLRIA